MGRREFIVLVSMLMALTALAIDMMLPAFGDLRADFGLAADSNSVALIVTVFFVGIGLGQLFNRADRNLGKRFLSLNRPHFFKNVRRQGFRHPPKFYFRAGNRFRTLGDGVRHLIYMSIGGIKNN